MLECRETDLDFYSRRAWEEARAAAQAATSLAGAVHRHMSAAYAARLREEEDAAAGFEAMLNQLQSCDDDNGPTGEEDQPTTQVG